MDTLSVQRIVIDLLVLTMMKSKFAVTPGAEGMGYLYRKLGDASEELSERNRLLWHIQAPIAMAADSVGGSLKVDTSPMMKPGRDYIGVGVGAMVFNDQGEVFLSQRGPLANNEQGCWEFPGGRVEFGEKLADAIRREFREEYGMEIEVTALLGVDDHILPDEGQHWVSPTYIAGHVGGTPRICEPEKCSAIGWFPLRALPQPLSLITQYNARTYAEKYG